MPFSSGPPAVRARAPTRWQARHLLKVLAPCSGSPAALAEAQLATVVRIAAIAVSRHCKRMSRSFSSMSGERRVGGGRSRKSDYHIPYGKCTPPEEDTLTAIL